MGSGQFHVLSTKCQVACILLNFCVFLICTTDACFFRNCPPGGKRSVPMNDGGVPKQCMTCGPEGKGRCAGPNICCHKQGCIIGEMAKECMQEDKGTTACEVKGIPCGADGQGRCVSDGVCCDTYACSTNSHCGSVQPQVSSRRQELLTLLKRLINKVD